MLTSPLLLLVIAPCVYSASVYLLVYDVQQLAPLSGKSRFTGHQYDEMAANCPTFYQVGTRVYDTSSGCFSTGFEVEKGVQHYYKFGKSDCQASNTAALVEYADNRCRDKTGRTYPTGGTYDILCGAGHVGIHYVPTCSLEYEQKWVNEIKIENFVYDPDVNGRYVFRGATYSHPSDPQGKNKTWWQDNGYFIYYCPKYNDYRIAAPNNWNNMEDDPSICAASARAPIGIPITNTDWQHNMVNRNIPGEDPNSWQPDNEKWNEWNPQEKRWQLASDGAGVTQVSFASPDLREPNVVTLSRFNMQRRVSKEYIRATSEWDINGESTFWSEDKIHFLFYCHSESDTEFAKRWMVGKIHSWCRIKQEGACRGLVKSPSGRHILHPAHLLAWDEFNGTKWPRVARSGVEKLHTKLENGVPVTASPLGMNCDLPIEANGQANLSPSKTLMSFAMFTMLAMLFNLFKN